MKFARRNFEIEIPDVKKVVFSQNTEISGNTLKMNGASFIVAEI